MPDLNQLPDPAMTISLLLADEPATRALGEALAASLFPGLRIYLRGHLGAGKTTLVRSILKALGYQGRVKSPTYTLVELYPLSRLNLYHFDFYRFRDRNEWREAGFSDYFDHDNVCLVEWPEKAGQNLPDADLDIALEVLGYGEHVATDIGTEAVDASLDAPPRRALLRAHTPVGQRCLRSAALSTLQEGFS